jgi:TP901 family phage tail tape measure protein
VADIRFTSDVDFKGAEAKVDELYKRVQKLQAALGKPISAKIDIDSSGLDSLNQSGGALGSTVGGLQSKLGGLGDSFVGVDGKLRNAQGQFVAAGNSATGLGGKLSGLGTAGTKGLGGLGSALQGIGPAAFAGPAAGAAVLGAGLLKVIDIGGAFEDQVKDMQAIIGTNDADTEKLAQKARDLSKAFGIEATQGVESFKLIIGALGPEVAKDQDALNGMAKSVLTFAKAGGIDAAEATQALTVTLSQFGFGALDAAGKQKKMAEISNVMAAAAKEGAAEIPDLSAAMTVVGATASGAKLSVQQTASALEALAPAGIKGAEAGTAFRNILLKLSSGTEEAKSELKAIGLTFDDVNPEKVGLTKSLETLQAAYSKVQDPVKRAALMAKLFGAENSNAAKILLASAPTLDSFEKKITGTQTANEQAALKMSTFNERMAQMKVKLEDVAITLFNALKPALDVLLDVLGFVIDLIDPLLQAFGFLWGLFAEGVKWVLSLAKAFGEWVASLGFVKAIVAAVQVGWKQMIANLVIIKKAVADSFGKMVEMIKLAYTWLATKLQPVFKAISSFLKAVWNAIWTSATKVVQYHVDIVKMVWGWIKKLWDIFIGVVSAVVKFTAKLLGLGGVLKDVTAFIKNLVKQIGGFVEDVARFLGLLGDSNEAAGERAGQSYMTGFTSQVGPNFTTGLVGVIGNSAGPIGEAAGRGMGDSMMSGMSEAVSDGAEREKPNITNSLIDFWDQVISASRAAREATLDVIQAGIDDEATAIDFASDRRIADIKEGYADELAALDEKIAAEKVKQKEATDKGEIYNLEIKNLEEARRAIGNKQAALIAKENDARLRAHQDLLLKLYDEELAAVTKSHTDIINQTKLRIEAERKLLDTSTVEGARTDTAKQLELMAVDYRETARQIAEATPEYQQAVAGIRQRIEDGLIDAQEGAIEAYEELRRTIARLEADGNSLLAALLRAHLKEMEDLRKAAAEKERERELAEMAKGNAAFRAMLAIRLADWDSYWKKYIDSKRKARQEEVAIDAQSVEDLRDKLRRGLIDRSTFLDELAKLKEASQKTAEEQTTFWQAMFGGIQSSMSGFVASTNKLFEDQSAVLHSTATDDTKTLSDTWKAATSLISPTIQALGAQIVGLAADTKITLREFAREALILALDALKRLASIAAAELIFKAVANPIVGAIAAATGFLAIQVALSAAQAAVAGFKGGGYTGRGDPSKVAGHVHYDEWVARQGLTRQYLPFFQDLERGIHPLSAAMKRYGAHAPVMSSRSGVAYDPALLQEVRAVGTAMKDVKAEVTAMRGEYESFHHVDIGAEFRMRGEDLVAVAGRRKRNSNKGR